MLQSVRESLKGSVVSGVIILFFVLPMVIAGVGSSWLGSVAGTDAAKVDGRTISKSELNMAIRNYKDQRISQGVDPSDVSLSDENLVKPVLEQLTNKEALLAAFERGGMGVSDAAVNSFIVTLPAFQVDGKFDAQTFRNLLARRGMNPSIFRADVAENLMMNQVNAGLGLSSFVTEDEKSALIGIIHEKRSFYTVDIPGDLVKDKVAISDEELDSYYTTNQSEFEVPEKVTLSYIELSVDDLAKLEDVSEDDIRAQYDSEVAAFDATPETKIAHILVKQNKDAPGKISEIQQKLADGEDFTELAKTYSEDAGSKSLGGELGVMLPGVYPEAFEKAVASLEEGQVSAPVETDSGVHFIKIVSKSVTQPPSFEERQAAIASDLSRARAEEKYLANLELLEELTFDAPDLSGAAAELGLEVQVSDELSRDGARSGIGAFSAVRSAAFGPDVLSEGHNSRVVEIAPDRTVVFRLAELKPAHITPFDEVKEDITSAVRSEKEEALFNDLANGFIEQVKAGAAAEAAAETLGYSVSRYDGVKRSDPIADPLTLNMVFQTPVADATAFDTAMQADGSYRIIGVVSKQPGTIEDVEAQQLAGLVSQLSRENGRFEGGAFQQEIVSKADIELN
ncbi:peptidyl-prolyl cis-trans isomerase D [Alteromonadaceae bacterium Bs31]|nr:peptidyl-prolyl cis-trans isomerase D [Alteromonadaceae bacterium Bs31]